MRRARLAKTCAALAGLMVAGLPPASGAPENFALEPYQMVRSLQLIQDRIANGDSAAMPMQRKLLEMIDLRLRKIDIDAFTKERNFRALLMYAMSGGNPRTAGELLARAKVSPADKILAKGVMAYINGHPADAITALRNVDPLAEEPELGAFLALVKGSILAAENPKDALSFLAQARLLAPGTLIEEAALRRSMALTAQIGDKTFFLRVSDEYIRRFLHSPYAGQFADSFVAGVVKLRPGLDLNAIAAVVSDMDPEHRRFMYLRLARAGTLAGQIDLAAFASKGAEPPATGGKVPPDPRAGLYASIASIASGNIAEVVGKLQAIDPNRLSESDRRLRDAAIHIAREVSARPPMPKTVPPPIPDAPGGKAAAPSPAPSAAPKPDLASVKATETLVSQASRQLQSIDKLLQETPE
jgi:chemotaxis protein MotC